MKIVKGATNKIRIFDVKKNYLKRREASNKSYQKTSRTLELANMFLCLEREVPELPTEATKKGLEKLGMVVQHWKGRGTLIPGTLRTA